MGYSRQTSPFQTPRGASGETSLAAAPAEASFRTGPSCHQVGVLGAQAARAFIVTIWSQFSSHSKNMLFHSITSFSFTLQPWRKRPHLLGTMVRRCTEFHFPIFMTQKTLTTTPGVWQCCLLGEHVHRGALLPLLGCRRVHLSHFHDLWSAVAVTPFTRSTEPLDNCTNLT